MQLRDKLGICQWFHYEAYDELEQTLKALKDLNVKHFRTGISWADYYRPNGKQWYDFQMRYVAEAGLEVLLSVWHTPPSIGEVERCAAPPRNLKDYADFIDLVICDYGTCFSALELWNEPNNRYKWDFENFDPHWEKFAKMVGGAGYWARQKGVTTVLGGMIPIDPAWLRLMEEFGTLQHMDVVAVHGFPEMWWDAAPNWEWYQHWDGWHDKLKSIEWITKSKPVWITETGLATWDLKRHVYDRDELQVAMLKQVIEAPADRIYWYSTIDLNPARSAIEGFHVDENEYHMGLMTFDGVGKPAYHLFKEMLATEISEIKGSGPMAC